MSDERLVGFLYILMRDELPLGKVAAIVKNHCDHAVDEKVTYTNKQLESYAREIAAWLSPPKEGT